MKIRDGLKLKELFASTKDWWTLQAVADGLKISKRTAHKLFSGKNINHATAMKVARELGVETLDIAEFVN